MENVKEKVKPNKGGRPNVEENEALIHRLVTRMNSKEYKEIENEYKNWKEGRAGCMSDFLREIINKRKLTKNINTIVQRESAIELTQALYNIRQQLKRIEVNYNQVAKRINSIEHTGKLYFEVLESKQIIDQLAPIIDQIDGLVKVQTETFYKEREDGH